MYLFQKNFQVLEAPNRFSSA